jgi:hypothetical protein
MGDLYSVNEIEKQNISKPITKHRDLFLSIIHSTPVIQAINLYEDSGDMSFSISAKDIGLSLDDFQKYHQEIFSHFVVDFVGELLVRENLNSFVPYITEMKSDLYIHAVSHSNHQRFGMKFDKGELTFRFHISLLQRILTQDFKNV